MRKATKELTIKQCLAFMIICQLTCIVIWVFSLWVIGAKLDYRSDAQSSFIALRLAPQTGISFQWSDRGQSIWFWTPEENRRLWISEY